MIPQYRKLLLIVLACLCFVVFAAAGNGRDGKPSLNGKSGKAGINGANDKSRSNGKREANVNFV